MKLILNTPRKVLRYLMFAKKNGVVLDNPILSEKKDVSVIKYFEKQDNFTSWDDFEIKWDIGMGDDAIAKGNRLEKWFLADFDKTEIVARPADYWDKEASRRGISSHSLFLQECNQRSITLEQFFKLFF